MADLVACSLIVAAAPPVPLATGVFACAAVVIRATRSNETRRSRFIARHHREAPGLSHVPRFFVSLLWVLEVMEWGPSNPAGPCGALEV